MQDLIELLIAFALGFLVKQLLGTVCGSRLVEPSVHKDPPMPGFGEFIENIGKKGSYNNVFSSVITLFEEHRL